MRVPCTTGDCRMNPQRMPWHGVAWILPSIPRGKCVSRDLGGLEPAWQHRRPHGGSRTRRQRSMRNGCVRACARGRSSFRLRSGGPPHGGVAYPRYQRCRKASAFKPGGCQRRPSCLSTVARSQKSESREILLPWISMTATPRTVNDLPVPKNPGLSTAVQVHSKNPCCP